MRTAISLLLALQSVTYTAEAQYLATLQQCREASDLVCIGVASAPVWTGFTRTIDGSDRDQLSTKVELETCFKGKRPTPSSVRVFGYDVMASKDVSGGYVYAGPPTGHFCLAWTTARHPRPVCRSVRPRHFQHRSFQ